MARATYSEFQSMTGSAAAMCVEAAPDATASSKRPWRFRERKDLKPKLEDALDLRTCARCGYPGPHPTAEQCITALRDRLALFE